MKTVMRTIACTGALLLGANVLPAMTASPDRWENEWFKAKVGRNSPMMNAAAAYREEPAAPVAFAPLNRAEEFFKAKLGRSSPMEEARLKAEREVTAFREEAAGTRVELNVTEQFFKEKFGRAPKR